MAYRPSPAQFPETLAEVPPNERNFDRAATSVNLTLFAVAVLVVSLAYGRAYVVVGDLRELWKPGLGILGAFLVAALFVKNLIRRACFVRRGDWVAIYRRGGARRVISIGDITLIQLRKLQTFRLGFACVVVSLIGLIGLPVYARSDDPSLVGMAWFAGAVLVGIGFMCEVLLGRLMSTTVRVESVDYQLRRAP